MVKKIAIIFLLILIVIILIFGIAERAQKTEGNYIKDRGIRYETIMDAINNKVGSDQSKLIVSLEVEGFVGVAYWGQGGTVYNLLYKDEKGYFPSNTLAQFGEGALSNEPTGGFLVWDYLQGKYLVHFDGYAFTESEKQTVTDNYSNKFEYVLKEDEGSYIYIYMLVLDEIPEDYRVIIDGIEYELPKEQNDELNMILLFSGIIGIILLFNIKGIRRYIREKRRKRLSKNIFD